MNVIFVDIDGPLLSRKAHMFHKNRSKTPKTFPEFDEFSVRAFNLWAKYSNAKIVFSTHWAFNWTEEELKAIMKHNGLGFDYHTEVFTPKKMTSSRASEIMWWVKDNLKDGDRFIAVDDDTSCQDIKQLMDNMNIHADGEWINVDFDNGTSWDNFLDGCIVLGIDMDDIYEQEFGIKPLSQAEKDRRATLMGAFQ